MPADSIADSFRRWGYLQAELDPLGRLEPFAHPELDGADGEEAGRWRSIYCGPIGVEFLHMPYPDRTGWIAKRMEGGPPAPDRRRILRRLAEAELLERALHRRYVGTKRYSLEGAASIIPFLDELLDRSAGLGAEVVILAMTHRGRLNAMVNIVGIPLANVIAGFEDIDPRSTLGGGDLNYHRGATGLHRTPSGAELQVRLVSNPSHLEAVDPVAMGRARARQERTGPGGREKVLPVTLHGDAAFAGQGILAETLNMSGLRGFSVGGTVQVLVNNLIGFTTEPPALHSSRHATSVARRVDVPIFHVNGGDPEAVLRVARLAADYRARFGTDVVVDLVGFRRYGHSEIDDPSSTQPLLYDRIERRPMLWEEYGECIGVTEEELESLRGEIQRELDAGVERGREMEERPSSRTLPSWWDPFVGGRHDPALEVETGVAAETLERVAGALTALPAGFHPNKKIARGIGERREMGSGERDVDWGMAETLAFGSLLLEGIPVRLAGQDSRRGTFNHRHAALFDAETGEEHIPLRHLSPDQARFDAYDTTLSEAAALGFEYGFSRDYPEALVCWEAQFGDFANGAQIILDQFVAAGEDKWGLLSGLVLLLPHGHEGQGPEHSSARVERFLTLAAEHNMQICQPTTAAQYFHLLRRQALRRWRKPLVVFTPKGMLRAAAAASPRRELTEGAFRPVIGTVEADPERLLLCSGRIAHELRKEKEKREDSRAGIVRLEQLYPFPDEELRAELERHEGAREIVWVQEEPANMGALRFVRPRIEVLCGDRHLTTVNRSASASPATGSAKAHAIEQAALIDLALRRGGASGR